jgi:ribosomal protein S27E
VRDPGGWLQETFRNGTVVEHDTYACRHCGHQTIVPHSARTVAVPRCTICGKRICRQCVGKGCYPLEKQIERIEAADRLRREMGLQ